MIARARIKDLCHKIHPDYQFIINNNSIILSASGDYTEKFVTPPQPVKQIIGKDFYSFISEIMNLEKNSHVKFEKFIMGTDSLGMLVLNGKINGQYQNKLPAIFLLLVQTERSADGTQSIKFFNYLSITQWLTGLFINGLNIFPKLNPLLNDNLQKKSLYFALNCLVHISAIIPFVKEENKQVFATILEPFHRTVKKDANPLTYRKEFKRYVETDKEIQIKKLGYLFNKLQEEQHCIPMQELKNNIFFEITQH